MTGARGTRRALLIAYYFPPLAGSGTFRPLRLARYLPRHGWEITVITVDPRIRVLKDARLADEVPPEVSVVRTATLEPRNLLLALRKLGLRSLSRRLERLCYVPDDQRGWVPFAVRAASRVLRERSHDVVISTSGPVSAHLVGYRVSSRLPWVADFRDEWTTNPYLDYPTAWHERLNRRLERQVLTTADRVVCVSEPWLNNLHGLVPHQPREKFRVHPNGYDAAHFTDAPAPAPEKFNIVYTGTFYGHRSPAVFIEAVRRVLAQGRIPAVDLRIELMGHTSGLVSLAELPAGVLQVIGQRPYHDARQRLERAAALLLVVPAAGGVGNHTGKLFNYLASGRPILALAPDGNVAAELIRDSRSGVVVAPDDVDAVASALVELYDRWRQRRLLPDQDRRIVARFEADTQAAAWARMLDELVGERRDPIAPAQ